MTTFKLIFQNPSHNFVTSSDAPIAHILRDYMSASFPVVISASDVETEVSNYIEVQNVAIVINTSDIDWHNLTTVDVVRGTGMVQCIYCKKSGGAIGFIDGTQPIIGRSIDSVRNTIASMPMALVFPIETYRNSYVFSTNHITDALSVA